MGSGKSGGVADVHSGKSLRRRIYQQLEPSAYPGRGLSPTNRLIAWVIIAATLVAIIRTEPQATAGRERWFGLIEYAFAGLFAGEYLLRLWSSGENPAYRGVAGRLRFATRAGPLLDLLAVLVTLLPFIAANLLPLRVLRLAVILRFAKLGRFTAASRHLADAIRARRFELMLTAMLAAIVMVLGATALWMAEGDVQPDKFGSIPRALWWAGITLTTIGYGDVYPVTALGKFIALVVAVAGIGLIAMPTGILASALSDAMQRERDEAARQRRCD